MASANRGQPPVQNFWEWLTDENSHHSSKKKSKSRQIRATSAKSPRRHVYADDAGESHQSRTPQKRPRTLSAGRVSEEARRRHRKERKSNKSSKSEAHQVQARLLNRDREKGSRHYTRRTPGDKDRRHKREGSSKGDDKNQKRDAGGLLSAAFNEVYSISHDTSPGPSKSFRDPEKRRTRPSSSSSSRHRRKVSRGPKNVQKDENTIQFLKEVLNREIVFQKFGPDVIDEVIKVMYKVLVKKGEIMIRQGDVGDTYHVVEEGHFHIRVKEPNGKVKLVAEALRGNAIGDASLFYNTPRRATLEAAENSIVWALDAADFRKIRQRWSQRENAKLEKIRTVLKKFPLFKQQSDEELTAVAKSMREEQFNKGVTIVTQGQPADKFYLIRRGTARVLKSNNRMPNSDAILVNTYEHADFFGERGIILGEPRAATVIATSDLRCFVWDKSAFTKSIAVGVCERIFYQAIESYKDVEEPEKRPWKNKLSTQLSEFIDLGVLGVGSFGRVSLVKCPHSNKTYSLKSVTKNRVVETGQQEHMKNERLVMTMINSKFTVRLEATYQDTKRVYFLMEAVLGGELFTVLRFNRKFSERTAKFYAGCCVAAFEHMHSLNILYRDLKPENLLLTDLGYIKLTDFGFAKKRNNTSTLCGTPEYLAPEVIRNWTQSYAVDWWTLGILIYEMIVSNPPFDDDDGGGKKMYEKILMSQVQYPRTVSRAARDLIDKLLKKNAYQRLGAAPNGSSFVKAHAWWKNFDWDALYAYEMETPYVPRIRDREDLSNYESYPDEDDDTPLCADPGSDVFGWSRDF